MFTRLSCSIYLYLYFKIKKKIYEYFQHNPASFISFPAIVDKHFLVERPIGTYRRGDVNGESFFMTFTKDEGSQHGEHEVLESLELLLN